MGNARVERFSTAGEFIGAWGAGTGDVTFTTTQSGLGPTGIAVGQDGLIYVTDTWAHRIVVLDPSGKMVREFGSFGDTNDAPTADQQPGLFFGPRDVAVTTDEIYVADTGNERIQVFGKDGTFRRAFGGHGSGPGQLIEPVGIALGPDGRVYVADSGNARISVFASTGTPLAQRPVPSWQGRQFFEPYLAFGPDGYLYATSSQTGSVDVFTPNGQQVETIRAIGGEQLQAPIGITAGPDGSMLITDTGTSAVYRYQPPPRPAPAAASPIASPIASPVASPVASPAAIPVGSPAAAP
jgi:DNA-binding beta-propeller fold protein YncE